MLSVTRMVLCGVPAALLPVPDLFPTRTRREQSRIDRHRAQLESCAGHASGHKLFPARKAGQRTDPPRVLATT